MNVVVLLKQVPDTESLIEINADASDIKTDNLKWIVNPYDELAVEEGIRMREKLGSGKVTVLSVGPERVTAAIRTALAMGADEGALISDPALEKLDPLTTAKVLAAALKTVPFDLIIAGQRAVDDDSYLVPSAVAEYLGIPMLGMVVRQEITGGKIRCEQSLQDGTAVVEADLPALLTTQRGLNQPRYASLPNIMKAKKKPLETKSLLALGLDAARFGPDTLKTRVLSLAFPPQRKVCKMISGETAEEKAARLVQTLREEVGVL
jgi:electron transfer flavoprotein beta subunit